MLYKEPPSWTNSEHDAAIRHGLQIEALQRVTARLTELRQSKTAIDPYEFQAKLLGDVYWVQVPREALPRADPARESG
jgi:hypothetical protein